MKWFEGFCDEDESERPQTPPTMQEPNRKRYRGRRATDTPDAAAIEQEGGAPLNVAGGTGKPEGCHGETSEAAKIRNQENFVY